MESPEAVEGTEEPEPEPQPTENPQLEPPNAEATPPPTAPQALVNLCRQSASDGCESLHIAHLSPDETTCTYLSLDNCPTYDRRGLQGVDLPFSWRLLSARVSVTSGGDNSPECLPGALIQAGRRAESVRGEVFWDEDLADPVPEQVELDLVVTVEPIGQPAFDSAVSTPAPLSTQTACAD